MTTVMTVAPEASNQFFLAPPPQICACSCITYVHTETVNLRDKYVTNNDLNFANSLFYIQSYSKRHSQVCNTHFTQLFDNLSQNCELY